MPNDLIIWDSHFGLECGFLPEEIAKLNKVKRIATFNQSNDSKQVFNVVVFKITN